jgi:hypothetical protein
MSRELLIEYAIIGFSQDDGMAEVRDPYLA